MNIDHQVVSYVLPISRNEIVNERWCLKFCVGVQYVLSGISIISIKSWLDWEYGRENPR